MKKIGLVLCGGGARGIAHIGVLRALEEQNIRPSVLSTCSAGALIGALYASGKQLNEIYEFMESFSLWNVYSMGLPKSGISSINKLRTRFLKYMTIRNFEDLQIPFHVSVTNIHNGYNEIISAGDLIEPVMASCAIPMLFQPIRVGEKYYVDGGITNNLPAKCIRDKCDVIIGVNVLPRPISSNPQKKGFFSMTLRSSEIVIWNNTEAHRDYCDVLIEPREIIRFNGFDFKHAKEIEMLGYKSTMNSLDSIKEILT